MSSVNGFFTQASNFSGAASSGVGPRIGLYNLTLSLGVIKGNGGNGPDFPVNLGYTPLSQGTDMGFGDGISLGLSTLNIDTGRLLYPLVNSTRLTG